MLKSREQGIIFVYVVENTIRAALSSMCIAHKHVHKYMLKMFGNVYR